MITISLCMIVKNEQDMIGNCLASVKDVVDEIIIVDTGSTDRTKEVVSQYTDKIYDFTWINDFSAARNYSFSKAEKDYILWLDADDVLLKQDSEKLAKLKEELEDDIDSVSFLYNYAFDEEENPTLVFRRERMVKRIRNYKWNGFIHEYIEIEGKRLEADICVTHKRVHGDSDRNLNIYREKKKEGRVFLPRDQYYYAKELYYHALYEEAIKELDKFLPMPSWFEDRIDALNCIADCYISKNNFNMARKYLYEEFEICTPRAEGVYRIASAFRKEERYEEAIYWYTLIFSLEKPSTMGFIYDDYWTWKPHLELCLCYYRTGDLEKALYHNQQAGKIRPNDESVKFNEEFFRSIGLS